MESKPVIANFDELWKEGTDVYFQQMIQLLFPAVYTIIDWSKKFESHEQELREIFAGGTTGKCVVDKLFKVYRKDGVEAWLYLHLEIQAQYDKDMPQRMYIYHCRLVSKQKMPLIGLMVLGDDNPNWRPDRFEQKIGKSEIVLKFDAVKLLDFKDRIEEIRSSGNPFAYFVIAHLRVLETKKDPQKRFSYKEELTKALLEEGVSEKDATTMFRFIDALMKLPPELEEEYLKKIHAYQEEKKMPFIAPFEEIAMEKGKQAGLQEGRQVGLQEGKQVGLQEGRQAGLQEGNLVEAKASLLDILEVLFDEIPASLTDRIKSMDDVEVVRKLRRQALQTKSLQEFETLLDN